MAYDGSIKEGKEADLETSFAIGVFGYNGTNTNTSTAEDYKFYRSGFDINAYYKKLNLVGGLIMGTDKDPDSNKYNLFFVEANYMFYPWLTGLIRYEQANPENLDSVSRVVPHISALVVANVKFRIESRLDPADLKFDNLYLGLDFAF